MVRPAETFELTELQYSKEREGPFALYIFGANGYHGGKQWFAKIIRYPDEQITIPEAYSRMKEFFDLGAEIRICDPGDMLVFHAKDQKVLYGESFWKDLGQEK